MTRLDRLALSGALGLPWLFIWQGLDFTDQGYLLTGYRCFFRHPEVIEDSAHMWLTNLIGASWDALFGGLGVVSIRGLWALCMSLGMLLAFRLLRDLTSERAAALSALVASAFLSDRRETWFSYNTISSLLFAAAAVCTVLAVSKRNRRWLFTAGVVIGLGPFARFPNVLACALVSALGLAAYLDAERRRSLPRDAGIAVLGVFAGAAAMLAFIYLRGDGPLYVRGVRSLFAPAMQEAGYDGESLLSNFAKDEAWALAWGLGVCVVGAGLARVLKLLPFFGQLALMAAATAVGVYGLTQGDEPWRWVVPGTTYFVLAGLALGVWKRSLELRVAAWAVLIVVLIAPLGSNNGIKNAHMGLWLALPVVLASLDSLGPEWLAGQGSKLAVVLGLSLCGEAAQRAATYTYRDAERSELLTAVGHPQLRGQFTTPARAKVVAEVLTELEKHVAPGDYLLAYEGTPLLQYLTKTRPYLNRPWLMGWERGDVAAQLAAEAPSRTGCLPVMVVTSKSTRGADWPTRARRLEEKPAQRGVRKAMNAFLRRHGYKRKWKNGFFEIYEPPVEGRVQCR